jgi:spore maturation protein CgeB
VSASGRLAVRHGYFRPGEHYIPLRRDFADLDEALERFGDAGERARVAANAYDVAVGELSYERLVGYIRDEIEALR